MSDRPESSGNEPADSSADRPGTGGSAVDPLDLEALGWRRTYERSAIEKFALEVDAERDRLRAAIDDAERRLTEAREAARESESSADRVIAELVAAARRELARIETERDEAVAAIGLEAEREAERILDEARRAAAVARDAVAALQPRREIDERVDGSVPPMQEDGRHAN